MSHPDPRYDPENVRVDDARGAPKARSKRYRKKDGNKAKAGALMKKMFPQSVAGDRRLRRQTKKFRHKMAELRGKYKKKDKDLDSDYKDFSGATYGDR